MKKYPFKFLDAYEKEDKQIFFGRDEEIAALYQLVFQTNLLLVYGPSGTGKTSLIRCGLANRFKSSQWLDLYIRRGSDINESFLETVSKKIPKTQSARLVPQEAGTNWFTSMMEADQNSSAFSRENKSKAIANPVAQALEELYQATFTPIYLIFDQFEELYTLGNLQEQQKLNQTITELLQLSLPIRIIIVMREEYLARLYHLEKTVPQLLSNKLRVEPMDRSQVEKVILSATVRNPQSNVKLKSGQEAVIVKAIVEKIREGDVQVKLPYLQVFMDRLYEKATGAAVDRQQEVIFDLDLVQKMGDISDVLKEFINQQSKSLRQKLKEKYTGLPTDIVWQILSPFATIDGTKVPIREIDFPAIEQSLNLPESEQYTGLIKEAVVELETSRILRYRKEEQTYEVAHDTLAQQIAEKRSEEEKTYLKARRMVTEAFVSYPDTKTLLSKEQLSFIRPYEKRLKREIQANDQTFINDSKNSQWWKKIRLRGSLAVVLIVAIGVIIFVNRKRQEAVLARENAVEQTIKAGKAEDLAKKAGEKAENTRDSISRVMEILKKNGLIKITDNEVGSELKQLEDQLKKVEENGGYLIRLNALEAEKNNFQKLEMFFNTEGYNTLTSINWENRDKFTVDWEPSIFYYHEDALERAQDLASQLTDLMGKEFTTKKGSENGYLPGLEKILFNVHYP